MASSLDSIALWRPPLQGPSIGRVSTTACSRQRRTWVQTSSRQRHGSSWAARMDGGGEAGAMLSKKQEIVRALIYVSGEGLTKHVVLRDRSVEVAVLSKGSTATDQVEAAELERGFDLRQDPLLRLLIIVEEVDVVKIVWTFHHIILDGWSLGVLINDFFDFYDSIAGNNPHMVVQEAPSFGDHVQSLGLTRTHDPQEFWNTELSGHESDLAHPYPRRSDTIPPSRDAVVFSLEDSANDLIASAVAATGLTASSILQFIWGLLLAQERGTDDILIGRVVSGRDSGREGFHEAAGMYVNTIPTRIVTLPGDTVLSAMKRMALVDDKAREFEHVPWSSVRRNLSNESLELAALFVLENYYVRKAEWQVAAGREYHVELVDRPEYSEFSLTLGVTLFNVYTASMGYDGSRYTRRQVERIATRYAHLLVSVLDAPTTLIEELQLLPTQEEAELLLLSHGPERVNSPVSVAGRLAIQIDQHPEQVALLQHDRHISYGQLHGWVSAIEETIAPWHLPVGSRVVVLGDNSIDTVLGMLGVLWSGYSFVTVDAGIPTDRLATICRESGAAGLLIAKAAPIDGVGVTNVAIIGDITPTSPHGLVNGPRPPLDPEREIYTIFTSGSTGVPKGVPVLEQGVLDLADAVQAAGFPNRGQTRVGLVASVAFDASLQQIFGALLNGKTLDVLPSDLKVNPESFWTYLRTHRIDAIDGTPSFWRMMLNELNGDDLSRFPTTFMVGGERMSGGLLKDFSTRLPGATVINAYGLSQTTPNIALFACRTGDIDALDVPVGKPIPGTSMYVFDGAMRLRGVGLIGEVCISGSAVTPGYLNAAERVASSVMRDPRTRTRMLKTGDLGYWGEDGLLRIVGRSDNQVKVNGYRIEPAEIEHALLAVTGIEHAAVVDVEEDKRIKLVAFIVCDARVQVGEIKSSLAVTLPAHMVPQRYVYLDEIPTTISGKINRSALRLRPASREPSGETIDPGNAGEYALVEVVGKVLKRTDVSISSDFFALGGDSIEAIRVIALLSYYSLTVGDIVAHPVFKNLARQMRLRARAIDQRPLVGVTKTFPIHSQLWRVTTQENYHHFNQSLLFEVSGDIDLSDLIQAGRAIVGHHDALRASFGFGSDELNVLPVDGVEPAVLELSTSEAELSRSISSLQPSLSPERGVVFCLALLRTERCAYVLIAIHHAVCDAVSLRIIAEDIGALLSARRSGAVMALPGRTDSIRSWQAELSADSTAAQFDSEESFWLAQLPPRRGSRRGSSQHAAPLIETEVSDTIVDGVQVTSFLASGLERMDLSLQAVLTAAFAEAFSHVTRQAELSLLLEGHGRQLVGSEMNVSRTIGWFTSAHPLRMRSTSKRSIDLEYCAEVRARIAAVPGGGLGFSWRYGTQLTDEQVAEMNATMPIFNYLGDFNSTAGESLLLPRSDRPMDDVAGSVLMENPLIVNVSGTGGRVRIGVRHRGGMAHRGRVKRLIKRFGLNLRRVCGMFDEPSFGQIFTASLAAIQKEQGALASVINEDAGVDVFAFPPAMLRVAYAPIYESLFASMEKYRVHVFHLQPGPAPEEQFAEYVRSTTGGTRPFAFIGYSGGANIAYETAIALQANDLDPTHMLFIDGFKWQTGLDYAVLNEDTVDGLVEQFVKDAEMGDRSGDVGDLLRALEGERHAFIAEGQRYREYAVTHQNRDRVLGKTTTVQLLSDDVISGEAEIRKAWQEVLRLPVEYKQGNGSHLSMLANPRYLRENQLMIEEILDEWRDASPTGSPIVTARGLTRVYGQGTGSVRALDGVDFEVRGGEIVVILGSSGSGKSTLLNTISTLDAPDDGDVEYFGVSVDFKNRRAVRNVRKTHMGFVFQAYNLVPTLNVTDNILLGGNGTQSSDAVEELALGLGIQDLLSKYPTELSGGEQQRVAIARALVKQPAVLFCDEPTGALDTRNSKAVLHLLCEYRDVQGAAIVLVTHNPQIAELADRVITMGEGGIVSETRPLSPSSVDEIAWV